MAFISDASLRQSDTRYPETTHFRHTKSHGYVTRGFICACYSVLRTYGQYCPTAVKLHALIRSGDAVHIQINVYCH